MTRAPLLALFTALLTSSCGASLMRLPQGPGIAATDGRNALAEATSGCHAVTSFTAEVAVSGSANGQRVRATMHAGLEADAVRLEAIAYSQPVFVFVSRAATATLLLQRDNRVIQDGPADTLLEVITGVPLRTDTLKATFTGCSILTDFAGAREVESDWRTVPDADGLIYLHRANPRAPWTVAAASHRPSATAAGNDWIAEFRNVTSTGVPRDIRLRGLGVKPFDLHLVMSQIEINQPIDARAFRIQVPASAVPTTIDELRKSGPLGGGDGA